MQKKVVLVFFGQKGGGLQVLIASLVSLKNEDLEIVVLTDKRCATEIKEFKTSNVSLHFYDFPHSFRGLLRLDKVILNTLKVFFVFRKLNANIVVQIMPSPFDLVVDYLTSKNQFVHLIRMIHDSSPHFGEKWPSQAAVRRRIKHSTSLITFSNYVLNELRESKKEILKINLPKICYFSDSDSVGNDCLAVVGLDRPRILFIGRILRYKGLDYLLEVMEERYDWHFIIAGEGRITNPTSNAIVINRWLNNKEFDFLIDNADIIVFPYIDASQSGTIPLSRKKNKLIVVSEVGGIAEQVEGYQAVFRCKPANKASLLKAISEATTEFHINQKLDLANSPDNEADLFEVTFRNHIVKLA